jgi:hypothetical protein
MELLFSFPSVPETLRPFGIVYKLKMLLIGQRAAGEKQFG